MLQAYTMFVPDAACSERLDRFLGSQVASLSRERIKKAIRDGSCLLEGHVCTVPSTRLVPGQLVELRVEPDVNALTPQQGELNLIWYDEHLAVLDKPAGLIVHPSASCSEATLIHRLLAHFPQMASMAGQRPGIVHRLDKDTSGLMIVALNEQARLRLADDFAQHNVQKDYLALVRGVPDPKQGDIQASIGRHPQQKIKMALVPETKGGKPAHSRYKVLYAGPAQRFALLKVRIFTGRTHQIRVHMAACGHPIWGDALYGAALGGTLASRQMLHAYELAFSHPVAGNRLRFTLPPPPDFQHCARILARRMRPLVIVGAPGSGKSSLLRLLEKNGLPCLSADAIVRRLYEAGRDGWLCLHQRYGGHFTPNEKEAVDRRALFAAMYADYRILLEVQDMIHPLVRHELTLFWRSMEKEGRESAVAEIPLYLEGGWRIEEDGFAAPLLIGVYCNDAERYKRLATNRGWSQETQATLDAWQWSQARKMQACDMVIDNSASPEHLERQAEALLACVRDRGVQDERELDAVFNALWT